MIESLAHSKKENQSPVHLILQLEDARIGDHFRLKSIKKALSVGQELPESDRQYLEEQMALLKNAVDHQMMAEWAIDFVKKLRVNKERITFEDIEKSLEKEKNTYKIDKKFLARTSTQLKQMIEHERKIKWTLDLISDLKKAKVGDSEKLNHISKLLNNNENIDESDKQYIKEKAEHLKQIIDCKTKVTWTQGASMKLQENELKHAKKLEEIKQSAENGQLASQREQRYLDTRYEKLQSISEQQNKIEWTIQTIQKLKEFIVVDSKKLDEIKQLLEDEIPVPDDDIKFLREEYKLLQQMLKCKKEIAWTISMINELQQTEIGNPERLAAIKKALEDGRVVSESETDYLTHKYGLLMRTKKSEIKYETDDNENQTEQNHYNFILTGLNTAIKEVEQLQSKFQVA